MKRRVLKGICALLVGGLLIVHGAKQWDNMRSLKQDLLSRGIETKGVISSKYKEPIDWFSFDIFCKLRLNLVVDYTSVDGKPQQFSQKICSKSAPTLNSHYQIRYDPDNPKRAAIMSYIKYWNRGFEMLMGLAFLGWGISFLRWEGKLN